MDKWCSVLRLAPAIVLAIAAAACGGGSTSSDSSPGDAPAGDAIILDGTGDVARDGPAGDTQIDSGAMTDGADVRTDTGMTDGGMLDVADSGRTDGGGPDTGRPDSGDAGRNSRPQMELVAGGHVSTSSRFRLITSTVYGGSTGVSPASSRFVLREGVIGRIAGTP